MQNFTFRKIFLNKKINLAVPLIVFAILLIYTYALLFVAPYLGFSFNSVDGRISDVFVEDISNSLKVGDVIESFGSTTWYSYRQDRSVSFFKDIKSGDIVEIVVQRDNELLLILWVCPGFNVQEFNNRFFNIWWLAFVFWVIGATAQLFMSPDDTKWFLFITSNYLLSFFLIFGVVSSYNIWESSLLLHFVTWLIFPAIAHFHWLFPTPLKPAPNFIWVSIYIVCLAFAIGELLQIMPRSLYALPFLLTICGSVILLSYQYALNPGSRKEIALLWIGILLAILPTIVNLLIRRENLVPNEFVIINNVSFSVLPGLYFYVLSYRRLDNMLRIRASRIIAIVVFLVLLGVALLFITQSIDFSGYVTQTILFVTFFSILLYPYFQTFLEKRLLSVEDFIYENIQGNAESDRPKLDVFLCHSSYDKAAVREIYKRLSVQGWINPWLDEKNLLPGQDWDMEIEKAVESTDAVLVCLSQKSINKEGYIQKEIRKVLDVSDRKPEGTIFVIPLRLEECEVPRRLSKWQWVNYFEVDAYEKILKSLLHRLQSLRSVLSKS